MFTRTLFVVVLLAAGVIIHTPYARGQQKAAGALGAMGSLGARAADSLLACASDSDLFVRGAAAEALSKIGIEAVPSIIRVLCAGTVEARWVATIALGKMGPEASSAVPALARALSDSSDLVRWGAVMALGTIGAGAKPAVPALVNALSDRDEDIRREVSRILDRLAPSAFGVPPDWNSVARIIDTLTPGLMKECRVPGVSIAMICNRSLVWSKCYGVADARSRQPVTRETMFEACSMSKPVFAYLAMMLAGHEKLSLDTPLMKYYSPSNLLGQPGREQITARMVMSHTTGMPNWRKGGEESDGPLPVLFPPGSTFGYSGEGFYYLQKVVEQITGEPLDIHAARTLFAPLGLRNTSFRWSEQFDARIASGHDAGGQFRMKTHYVHPNAAYTLYVSAEDYARFLVQVLSPNPALSGLLSSPPIDSMLSHQVRVLTREPVERPGRARASNVYWGLGWCINATEQGDIVHHGGSNGSGFRCFSQFSPSRGSGIVIMTNGDGGTELWTRLVSRVGNL
jgi:CubicO group peptidase (beta-lactamase class C family)